MSVTPEAGDNRSRLLPVTWSGARDAALVRYRIGSGAGSVRLAIHDVRGRLNEAAHDDARYFVWYVIRASNQSAPPAGSSYATLSV